MFAFNLFISPVSKNIFGLNIMVTFSKSALTLLNTAGIANICFHSASHEQPLGATKNEKKFKVFLFDIGLAQRMLGLVLENWHFKALQVKTLGGIAEQLVGQQLRTIFPLYSIPTEAAHAA